MARTEIFISCSHEDNSWLEQLKPYLKPIERSHEIMIWDDSRIKAGQKWQEEIEKALHRAKVAVLLVSQSFLSSDFISNSELPRILEAQERTGLKIFWVAVTPSTYKTSGIEEFQAANDPNKPLDSLSPAKRRAELVRIAEKLRASVVESADVGLLFRRANTRGPRMIEVATNSRECNTVRTSTNEDTHTMATLHDRLSHYINAASPLGPVDTDLIQDDEVEAKLFDPHYTSFNKLLSRDINVVVGRRGSGKTALLNCYKYRRLFNGDHLDTHRLSHSDLTDYRIAFSIPTHCAIESLQLSVMGSRDTTRPIESVVDDWSRLISDLLLIEITRYFSMVHVADLSVIIAYLNRPETLQRLQASELVRSSESEGGKIPWQISKKKHSLLNTPPSLSQALDAVDNLLRSHGHKALFILDSMDEYQVGDREADRTIGALLRCVRFFNAKQDRMKIKIGLPSEIFPEIQRACANPLKDMVGFDQIIWTASELARVAAHRFRVFFEIYDSDAHKDYQQLDFNKRGVVRQFWSKMFDNDIKNEYGWSEDPMTYILRHTQLLPRQLIAILDRLIKVSYARTGGYRELKSELIEEAVKHNESIVASEIFSAYKYVFPFAERIGRALFGNFPAVFTYDELENKWRRAGRPFDYINQHAPAEFVEIMDMFLRIGIIGIVEHEPTEKYVEGMFSYNQLDPPNVGQGNSLCIHPIFGGYFRCAPNRLKRAVLPYGVVD